jgi:hypothetical protein
MSARRPRRATLRTPDGHLQKVTQDRREGLAARGQVLTLTAEEQLAFWEALESPPPLTERQKRLGSVMRGEG